MCWIVPGSRAGMAEVLCGCKMEKRKACEDEKAASGRKSFGGKIVTSFFF